jgi:pyridoxal phosphate enzyme (YggS family)
MVVWVVPGFHLAMSVADNIASVREQIRLAAVRAGRDPSEITLMAVSKTFPADRIREAYLAGIRHFGENRVQEYSGKIEALRDLTEAHWHMIGHLQTNKAGKGAELFDAVDSVDSLKLVQKLNEAARKIGRKIGVLIEVNVGGELAKTGLAPDSAEMNAIFAAAPTLDQLEIRGLLTIPPFTDDPWQARPFFRKVRELRDQIAARQLPSVQMRELSMGMSHDFEVGIEEGSTCVRLGTAIFGDRARA